MNPTPQRILQAGLLAGLLVNLVDVPNSAIVVSPQWTAFLAAQGVTLNGPLVGGYFTALHFVWGLVLMSLTAWLVPRFSPARAALVASGMLLLLQRGFGFGSVVMGQMPLGIWLQFSWSFVLGTCAGTWAGLWWLKR
jgi:hypothetical protein